jgi:long-chain acyl-CoA synthetase
VIDHFRLVFAECAVDCAVVWRDGMYTYAWLLDELDVWRRRLDDSGIQSGTVVAIEADFSPTGIALFLALTERRCILVPLTLAVADKKKEFEELAQVEVSVQIDSADTYQVVRHDRRAAHSLYATLRQVENPGLVLFSSGSTGQSKAAVHNLRELLDKFHVRRKKQRMIGFLLYDHIGGINTMLYALSNGGTIITVETRTPDGVLATIARHRAEVLPTSPTFMNLVLLSEAYRRHDLSSLTTVTYGTEPMTQSTLHRFHAALPGVTLLQTYGLSEVGILRSKSRSSDSLWVKVGGEGFDTRVVDGVLHIKARSAMLGYLNAPSPFTADGWFVTGDAVEMDGEYLRILGRTSEIINVGGQKVYPAEVESVIQDMPNVSEVTVYGERNAILGNIVCARVRPREPEEAAGFARRLRAHCAQRLERFKVPIRVMLDSAPQHSARFKKARTRDV